MSSPSSEFHAVSHGQSLQQAHNNLNPGNPGRFPNPGNLQADSTGSSYNGFVGGGLPFPRCNTSALRRSRHFVPNECKDEYYWHKRLKNNEAARKSRQKRRNIDSVLEEKVLVLSHENDMLRNELYSLKVKYGEISPHDPKFANAQPNELSPSDSKGLTATSSRNVTTTPDLLPKQETSQFNRNMTQEQKLQLQDPSAAAAALHKAMAGKAVGLPNVITAGGKGNTGGVRLAQGATAGMPFPSNLLISHLASGTYVLSPVSPNNPQNLIAGSQLLTAPVSQQTIVTVQQNPITAQQQRDGAQLVRYPSHQVQQLPMQAATLNQVNMQQQQVHKPPSLPSPMDTPPASAKDSDAIHNSRRVGPPMEEVPTSRGQTMFSFDHPAPAHEQRSHRKSIEQLQQYHRRTSVHSDRSAGGGGGISRETSNEQPVNLEVNKEVVERQTLATQTSPVSYYQPAPTRQQTSVLPAPQSARHNKEDSGGGHTSPYSKENTSFIPSEAAAGHRGSPKDRLQQPAPTSKPSAEQTDTSTATKQQQQGDSTENNENSNNSYKTNNRQQQQYFRSPQSPVESEGDVSADDVKRLSPAPAEEVEGYQVYQKAFHKLQDEKDYEAATTLATLSKRSKLHHLDPSSYSMDAVSSSLQVLGPGDEDGRKHRLPHKLRFKFHAEETAQQQPKMAE